MENLKWIKELELIARDEILGYEIYKDSETDTDYEIDFDRVNGEEVVTAIYELDDDDTVGNILFLKK